MTNDIQIATISAADLPARGERLAQGTFVGRYWVGDKERALVLMDHELYGPWADQPAEVETCWTDGMLNTRNMVEAGSRIAEQALELGGHIPSPVEANLLMAASKEGLIMVRKDYHQWLSAQEDAANPYFMDFKGGWQNSYAGVYTKLLVQPVQILIIQ